MASNHNIQLIIFDAGHVIVDFDWGEVCNGFAARARRDKHDLVPVMRHLASLGYEHGRISTEDFLKELNEQLQSNITLDEFKAMWIHTFEENQPMAELLQKLKRNIQMFLLSNTNEVHWEGVQGRYNIARHFDELVLSYKIGYAKPEKEIYEHTLSLTGTPPGQCLFIDDLKVNVEAADELGMNTVLFRGIDDLCVRLNALGVAY